MDTEDLVLVELENDDPRPEQADEAAASSRRPRAFTCSETRYKEPRRLYPWKRSDVGRRALCELYIHATTFGSDEDFVRDRPARLGVTGEGALAHLRRHCPAVFDEYRAATGKELTATVAMGRIGNMWRSNPTRQFVVGPEHPRVHKDLRPVLAAILAERPGTLDDADAVGG